MFCNFIPWCPSKSVGAQRNAVLTYEYNGNREEEWLLGTQNMSSTSQWICMILASLQVLYLVCQGTDIKAKTAGYDLGLEEALFLD